MRGGEERRVGARRGEERHTARMAYDRELADRLRELTQAEEGLSEKAMFGGLAFLIHGHMAVAASGQGGLMVRIDPARADVLVDGVHVTRMVMRGKAMDGWLRVTADAIADDASLARYAEPGLTYARSLGSGTDLRRSGVRRSGRRSR